MCEPEVKIDPRDVRQFYFAAIIRNVFFNWHFMRVKNNGHARRLGGDVFICSLKHAVEDVSMQLA
jgi:hypothetical protein